MADENHLSDEELEKISDRLDWFRQAEERAELLLRSVPNTLVYIGICGTQTNFESLELGKGLGVIRRVTNPPGIVHTCRAADLERTDYLAVSRYSSAIRAELALGQGTEEAIEHNIEMAYHIAALIKLKNHSNLFCPCFSTSSWDVISAISDNSVTFGMLDDIPRRVRGSDLEPITQEDIGWVNRFFEGALALRGVDISMRFGLAFNIAYTWNQTSDLRVALANLWCGVEALFGDKRDSPVTRKLVEKICSWLPHTSMEEVEESYNYRCDAVHGRQVGDELLPEVHRAESILRESLITCIETNSVPLPDWK